MIIYNQNKLGCSFECKLYNIREIRGRPLKKSNLSDLYVLIMMKFCCSFLFHTISVYTYLCSWLCTILCRQSSRRSCINTTRLLSESFGGSAIGGVWPASTLPRVACASEEGAGPVCSSCCGCPGCPPSLWARNSA